LLDRIAGTILALNQTKPTRLIRSLYGISFLVRFWTRSLRSPRAFFSGERDPIRRIISLISLTISNDFEPFFTTKESKKGAGLGLSLCKEFVRQIGRTIKVESKPGHGTTFLVALPTELRKEEGPETNDDSRSDR
jgi:two-component sensor histidine kinase